MESFFVKPTTTIRALIYKKQFDELEVLAAAQAIDLYREERRISDNDKVTVAIDGLSKSLAKYIGHSFRLHSSKIRSNYTSYKNKKTTIPEAEDGTT